VLAHDSFDSRISTKTFLRTLHIEAKLARSRFTSNTSSQPDCQQQHSIGKENLARASFPYNTTSQTNCQHVLAFLLAQGH